MKKKNRKKGFTRRLAALMLCCLFVLVSIPTAAMSIGAEGTQTVSEKAAVQPEEKATVQSEDGAAVPQTVSETDTQQGTDESNTESGNTAAADGENSGTTETQPEEKKDEAEQPTVTPTETPAESTPTPEATQTPAETPAEEKSASGVLYDRLMACATYEEMETILNGLTEEEEALLEQFTEEQQKALEAKVAELDGYDIDMLDDSRSITIQAGTSGKVEFFTSLGSGAKFTCSPSSKSITTSVSGKIVTINVGEDATAGKYTLTYKWYVNQYDKATYTINLTVTAPAQKTSTFNITNNFENTEVAYVDINNGTASGLTTVSNGQTITGTATGSAEHGWGALLFFVKPQDGYLFTTFENAAGTACDLYSTDVNAENSMIDYIRYNSAVGQTVLDVAKAQGYLGYFGFTYNGNSGSATYTTKAERPQMTVTATADSSTGVKPGDAVTYTVTIIPGHISTNKDQITGVNINSLTINGASEAYSALVANADGTYTTTVTHVVTDNDWENGSVKLEVSATVNYSYIITVKDRGLDGKVTESNISSTATVPNTASVDVPVAPKNPVRYHVTYEPTDLQVPEIITKNFPYDTQTYFEEDTVQVSTYGTGADTTPANVVKDTKNKGEWTFNGWYTDENLTNKAGTTLTMVEGGLNLYGKWTFRKTLTSISVGKAVKGNMGNWNEYFDFTVDISSEGYSFNGVSYTVYNGDNTVAEETKTVSGNEISISFKLKHNQHIVFDNLPIGAGLTVSEADLNYETTVDGTTGKSKSITLADTNAQIEFVNTKNAEIPTGVSLDSLPYLIVLAVVAVGGIVLLKTRRIRRDD